MRKGQWDVAAGKLEFVALQGIPAVQSGDDLAELICASLTAGGLILEQNDVVVVTQKIVSKSEARIICLADVISTDTAVCLAARPDRIHVWCR